MSKQIPPAFPDVEMVAEESSARQTNKLLKQGWKLLQVVAFQDSGGGYVVYVLGKVRNPPQASHKH